MGSSLALLCNSRIFVTDISYSYLYWHDLYPAMSDIYFMINLYAYFMLCMIRQLALVYIAEPVPVFERLLYHDVYPSEGWASRGILEYRLLM